MNKKITGSLIENITKLPVSNIYYGNKLGLVDDFSDEPDIDLITFIDDEKYFENIIKNKRIKSVFTTDRLGKMIEGTPLLKIICDDPRFYFYFLFNYINKENYKKTPSIISETAQIHSKSFISEYNVVIGQNSIIEPNVTILADVVIGSNVIIRAGAVIGSEGFEHKRTSRGILSVFHTGKVRIHDFVEIGANSCIDKGLIKDTIIEEEVRIDNLVHVAHSVRIGTKTLITAGVIISGSVKIGDNVWVAPGVTILNNVQVGNDSFIGIHSLVIRNVKTKERVFGIPAISI